MKVLQLSGNSTSKQMAVRSSILPDLKHAGYDAAWMRFDSRDGGYRPRFNADISAFFDRLALTRLTTGSVCRVAWRSISAESQRAGSWKSRPPAQFVRGCVRCQRGRRHALHQPPVDGFDWDVFLEDPPRPIPYADRAAHSIRRCCDSSVRNEHGIKAGSRATI